MKSQKRVRREFFGRPFQYYIDLQTFYHNSSSFFTHTEKKRRVEDSTPISRVSSLLTRTKPQLSNGEGLRSRRPGKRAWKRWWSGTSRCARSPSPSSPAAAPSPSLLSASRAALTTSSSPLRPPQHSSGHLPRLASPERSSGKVVPTGGAWRHRRGTPERTLVRGRISGVGDAHSSAEELGKGGG